MIEAEWNTLPAEALAELYAEILAAATAANRDTYAKLKEMGLPIDGYLTICRREYIKETVTGGRKNTALGDVAPHHPENRIETGPSLPSGPLLRQIRLPHREHLERFLGLA